MANNEESPNKWKILLSLSLGCLMASINTSIANVSLPDIGIYFNASVGLTGLVVTGYFISFIGLALFASKLGDGYGHDRIFKIGVVGMIITSIMCSISPSIDILILSRFLQGIAGALLLASPMVILEKAFAEKDLGKAYGIYSVSAAVGLAIGPTIGGLLQQLYDWRAIFLINVPLGIITFILAIYSLDKIERMRIIWDIKGLTTAFFSILFVIGTLNFIEDRYFLYAIIGAVLTAISVLGFIKSEQTAVDPLINLHLFRNKTFTANTINLHLAYIAEYLLIYSIPYFLEKVVHDGPGMVGVVLSAAPLIMIFIAPISGMITDKKGVVLPTVIGNIICIISLVLITFTTNLSHELEIFIVFAVYGLGCGLLQSPINKAIMVSVPEKYAGTASGVIPTSRSLGISFAVCYGGLILSYAVSSKTLEQETLFGVAAQELTAGLHYVAILGIILCILVIILSIAGRPEKKSYES